MPTALTKMYETMTLTEKQELYNFAEFLVSRRTSQNQTKQNKIVDTLASLNEVAGSCEGLFDGEDAVLYQRRIRENRKIG